MSYLLKISATGNQWSGRGSAKSKHKTQADAEAFLQNYVLLNWDYEMDGEPLPEAGIDIVEQYFEVVEEQYEIIHAECGKLQPILKSFSF